MLDEFAFKNVPSPEVVHERLVAIPEKEPLIKTLSPSQIVVSFPAFATGPEKIVNVT